MLLFASLAFIIISFFVIKIYNNWLRFRYLGTKFPHPSYNILVGHLPDFPRDLIGIFSKVQSLFEELGKNYVLCGLFLDGGLMLSDRNVIEQILSNPNSKGAKKSVDYLPLINWLGTGLLLSWGDKWFQRRKIITPSFHFTILERFMNVFNRQTDIFVLKIESYINKGDFDISNFTGLFTLDVICEASMGITINAQSQPDLEYVLAVREISTIVQKRVFHIFKEYDFLWSLTSLGRREKKLIKILHNFTNNVIIERRNAILKETSDVNSDKSRNFLDMLLHATIDGKPLSNSDIREEVETFMFEGHDTTASGIAFTLYELSQNEDVQEKVYDELVSVFRDSHDVTYQNLGSLKYMDMVIKETLRILPSVPFIGRQLTEETMINGILIPADTNIMISIFAMHRDPDYYPDPEKFDPERFADSTRHPFAYVPFSAGSRNCIGQKFAMLEMKSVVAKVILNYKLLPSVSQKDLLLQGDLILKSANGVYLQLERRQK